MTVTDKRVEAAIIATTNASRKECPEIARWPDDYDDDERRVARLVMRAALEAADAAEPDPRDAELARLRAEVERLNETLQIMADCGMSPHWVGKSDIPAAIRKLARAALGAGS